MALDKVTYTDNETVIYAQNLNDIQDEVIRNAGDITDNREAITALQSSKQDVLSIDSTPTENSTNPVSSGGVYTALIPDDTLTVSGKAADANAVGIKATDLNARMLRRLTADELDALRNSDDPTATTTFPFGTYFIATGSTVSTIFTGLADKVTSSIVYLVVSYKSNSTTDNRGTVDVFSVNGNEHYYSYHYLEAGWADWKDVSYFPVDDTLTTTGAAADAKVTGDAVKRAVLRMNSSEITAMSGDIINMPDDRYLVDTGSVIGALLGQDFPYTLSSGGRYVVQSFGQLNGYKTTQILRANGEECYWGLTAASHTGTITWYDSSIAPLVQKLDEHDTEIAELREGNSWNTIASHSVATRTSNSVTFTWNEDGTICTVNGTATGGTAAYVLRGSSSRLPDGIEPGKTYHFSYQRSGNSVAFGAYYYTDGSYTGYNYVGGTSEKITIPEDTTGLTVVLVVRSGQTANNVTVSNLAIREAPTNAELDERVWTLENTPSQSASGGMLVRIPEKGTNIRRALAVNPSDIDNTDLIAEYAVSTADNTSPKTSNGVTFTWNNTTKTLSIIGTATAEAYFPVMGRQESLNAFSAGKAYRFTLTSSSDDLEIRLIPAYDSTLYVSQALTVPNGGVFAVPTNLSTGSSGLNGYNVRVYVKAGVTYNTTCVLQVTNHAINFATESGPELGFSDYVECPEYLIVDQNDTTSKIVLNFYYKSGDEYKPRNDVLRYLIDETYQGVTYQNVVNRLRLYGGRNRTNNRVIKVPAGTYVSAATLTNGDVKLYGWNGVHYGPDLTGTYYTFDPARTDKMRYTTKQKNNLTGFYLPGDATMVWTKDAAIRAIYGLDEAGDLTLVAGINNAEDDAPEADGFQDYQNFQAVSLPKGYNYFVGNLKIDYDYSLDEYSGNSFQYLSGQMSLNSYLNCDSEVTPTMIPTGRSEDILELAEYLSSIRWKSLATMDWSSRAHTYRKDFWYTGVPYTSQWVLPTQVGWHISMHTLMNAINDPDSYFYEGHGRRGYGPGYGQVCTSFAELVSGYPYLIAVDQLEDDPMVQKNINFQPNVGVLSARASLHHAVLHGSAFEGRGYASQTMYEETSPSARMISRFNIPGFVDSSRSFSRNKSYIYECYHKNSDGTMYSLIYDLYDSPMDTLPSGIINGSARPHLGDRSVYTSEFDVVINIKDPNATTLYLQQYAYGTGAELGSTEGSPASIQIPANATSVEIDKSLLTTQKFYGVYTDTDDTQEYFEYRLVVPITYTVTGGPDYNGSEVVTFSNNNFWYMCFDAGDGTGESQYETPNGYYQTLPGSSYNNYADYSPWDGVVKPVGYKSGVLKTANGAAFYHAKWGAFAVPVTFTE